VGISGDQVLGPVVLSNRLTGAAYHFSSLSLSLSLLWMIYQHSWSMSLVINNMWFMHDETPPHFLPVVRQYLNQTFGEHWIGCGGPVNWPARSPYLNPLDFWLWGYIKTLVYSVLINDLEVLHQWVQNACQEICVQPGIFNKLCTSVWWRAESCVEMHGNHIEHLL
jgi:hypothetical protein